MANLVFNLNDGNEFVFDLDEPVLTLGRNQQNDLVIDNTYISGFHAEFRLKNDGKYELIDRKSFNGTFINQERMERGILADGDHVAFGTLQGRYFQREGLTRRSEGGPRPVLQIQSPSPDSSPLIANFKSTVPVDLKAPLEDKAAAGPSPAALAEARLQGLHEQVARALAQEEEARATVEALEAKRRQIETETEALATRKKLLQEQADVLPGQISGLQDEHRQWSEQMAALSGRHGALEKEVVLLEEKAGPLREEVARLNQQKLETLESIAQSSALSQKHQNEISGKLLELEKLELRVVGMTQAEAQMRQVSEHMARLSESIQQIEERRAVLNANLQETLLTHEEQTKVLEEGKSKLQAQEDMARHHNELEEKIRDLEERKLLLEQALNPEQCTVFVFAYDLIKRLDLIDDLLHYYQSHTSEFDEKRIIRDLTALRASLEDILNSHSIRPYRVPTGTEVSVQLRRRIKVVEIVPSSDASASPQPTVIESLRPGYACPNAHGEEVILRKLEVKISS